MLSLLLVMMGIPPLAFAIGMYLPLQINTPLFIGGLISHWVAKSSKDAKVSEARVAAAARCSPAASSPAARSPAWWARCCT